MVQVDLPAAFAIGVTYALFSKNYLKQEKSLLTSKALGALNFFISCGFVPGGMYLMVGFPAWEVMYKTGWVDNAYNNPPVAIFTVMFAVAMIILGNIGYILSHWCYQKGKDSIVPKMMWIGYFFALLPYLVDWGVWWKVGTYQEVVVEKAGYSFFENPFFYGLLLCFGWMASWLIAGGFWFKRTANKLEA